MVALYSQLDLQLYDSQSIWKSLTYWRRPAALLSMFRSLQARQVQTTHWSVSFLSSSQINDAQRITNPFLMICVARTMKHLSAMNILNETNADEFTSTHFSTSLTDPRYRDGISYKYENPAVTQTSFPTNTIKLWRCRPFFPRDTGIFEEIRLQKPQRHHGWSISVRTRHWETFFRLGRWTTWASRAFQQLHERISSGKTYLDGSRLLSC